MVKKLSILCLSILFCGSVAWAADSAGNRKDQMVRLGIKTGIHLFYLVSTPFVLEIPGEDFTFGLVYGSGDLVSTSSSYSSSTGWTTVEDKWTFSTTELTGRYYFGNSFNVPFGYAMYNIHKDDFKTGTAVYSIDYTVTQLNVGLGNDWTFDWGGFIAADWFQGGAGLSEEIKCDLTSGTESASTKLGCSTDAGKINAFGGALIVTFGFGF